MIGDFVRIHPIAEHNIARNSACGISGIGVQNKLASRVYADTINTNNSTHGQTTRGSCLDISDLPFVRALAARSPVVPGIPSSPSGLSSITDRDDADASSAATEKSRVPFEVLLYQPTAPAAFSGHRGSDKAGGHT